MTQINPNINPYNNQDYKQLASQVQQPVRLPAYYNVPDNYEPKNFKETVKDADPMGVLSPFIEHPLWVLTAWLGLNFGLDAYSKACSGKYENSLVAKAARLGDNIQQSKLIQNKPVQAVINGFNSVKKRGAKVVQNSAILRAMRDTPTMPEWSMVKSQMFNQKQEVVQDFIKIAEALKLDSDKVPGLKDIGLTKAEKDMLKKVFNVKGISEIPETKAVNQVLLSRLGRTPEQIKKIQALGETSASAVKKEILKEMGLTADKLKLIKDDMFGKYIDDVMNACGKVRGKVKMGAGHYSFLGPLTKPFERTIGCDEVYNKLFSMAKGGGAKTATGRFTSKMMQMIHRGLTFGGGKLGALIFIAPLLVEVGMNVKKADKDQKAGTLAGGLIESMSWVFTFPLALKIMHSLGGVKYAGMSKTQVTNYRDAVKDFNKKALGAGFKNKAEYKAAKKQVKDMLKVDKQNIFTKGIRKLGQFLTLDLETFKGYKNGNFATNFARKAPNFFRNVVGVPMRFAVWGLISMGVLDAAIKKCSTAIFGKSYDSMKQDEHKAELKQQKQFLREDLNKRLYDMQAQKHQEKNIAPKINNSQAGMFTVKGKNINSDKEFNLRDNYTYIPSSKNVIPQPLKKGSIDNYTYIPSSKCTIEPDEKNLEKQRKYIPSQEAANIQKSFDNSGLQGALDRAQKAEDKALRVLAGNFDEM